MNANGFNFKEADVVLAPVGEHSTPSLKWSGQAGRDDVITLSFECKGCCPKCLPKVNTHGRWDEPWPSPMRATATELAGRHHDLPPQT